MLLFYLKAMNFHNSGIVGNVLSIGLHYILSFKFWSEVPCYNNAKRSVLKIRG